MYQPPSVGTVVHYVSYGTPPRADGSQAYTSQCRAAIITEVPTNPDFGITAAMIANLEVAEELPMMPVGLCVLNPSGMFFNEAEYDEDQAGGTWHWPERV